MSASVGGGDLQMSRALELSDLLEPSPRLGWALLLWRVLQPSDGGVDRSSKAKPTRDDVGTK